MLVSVQGFDSTKIQAYRLSRVPIQQPAVPLQPGVGGGGGGGVGGGDLTSVVHGQTDSMAMLVAFGDSSDVTMCEYEAITAA